MTKINEKEELTDVVSPVILIKKILIQKVIMINYFLNLSVAHKFPP